MTVKSLERLTPQQSEEYERKGYLRVACPFSKSEVDGLRAEADRLFEVAKGWDEHNLRLQTRVGANGTKIFDRLDPVTDLSNVYGSMAADDRVAGVARDVFQSGARLLKDKMIFRRPGSSGYRIHQDYTGWQQVPAPAEALLTVAVALDASNEANGALQCYPGFHHEHYGDPEVPKNYFHPSSGLVPEECVAGCEPEIVELEPGDLLVLGSLTPHRSFANNSATTRRMLFLTYSDSSYGDLWPGFYERFHGYLRRDRTEEGLTKLYFE
jgi:ectoine hydroxylase-related dioxygenase (phytanoyl-CoA dioxygenase family)